MGFPGRYGSLTPKPSFSGPAQKKTVFGTHANLAHKWAQQDTGYGRSSDGRMFFEGRQLHSYSRDYTIACFTDGMLEETNPAPAWGGIRERTSPKRVVLFNSDTYSVSTGQHHSEARSALQGLPMVTMMVPYPDCCEGGAVEHGPNLDWLVVQFTKTASELANPRKVRSVDRRDYVRENPSGMLEQRLAALPGLLEPLHDYCRAFGLERPAIDLESHAKAIREAFARYLDPKAVAKRQKDAGRRQLKWSAALARYHAWREGVLDLSPADIAALPLRERKRVEYELYWKKHRDDARSKPITVEQWLDGQGSAAALPASAWPSWSADRASVPTLCRKIGSRLETSRGAVVPWQHALVAFYKAQRCRAQGKPWRRNGEQQPVGDFQLDSIDSDGAIHAGCHTIAFAEMLRLAIREIPQSVRPTFPVPAIIGG